jgi:Calcium-activated chloride channel
VGVSVHVLVVSIMRVPLYSALQTVYSVPVFCIFVAVWSQMMLEGWKKQEARLAFKWGMDLYEESELERLGLYLSYLVYM